jgi:hypothetical protein
MLESLLRLHHLRDTTDPGGVGRGRGSWWWCVCGGGGIKFPKQADVHSMVAIMVWHAPFALHSERLKEAAKPVGPGKLVAHCSGPRHSLPAAVLTSTSEVIPGIPSLVTLPLMSEHASTCVPFWVSGPNMPNFSCSVRRPIKSFTRSLVGRVWSQNVKSADTLPGRQPYTYAEGVGVIGHGGPATVMAASDTRSNIKYPGIHEYILSILSTLRWIL